MTESLEKARLDLLMQVAQRNAEYADSIIKWCNTTLSALNGWALVTLFANFEHMKTIVPSVAWIFGAGIISSILATFMLAWSHFDISNEIFQKIWKNDFVDDQSFEDVVLKSVERSWSAGLSIVLLIVSAAFLIFGSIEVMDSISGK